MDVDAHTGDPKCRRHNYRVISALLQTDTRASDVPKVSAVAAESLYQSGHYRIAIVALQRTAK